MILFHIKYRQRLTHIQQPFDDLSELNIAYIYYGTIYSGIVRFHIECKQCLTSIQQPFDGLSELNIVNLIWNNTFHNHSSRILENI